MGLGGPNLVKGATGQSVGAEELGGAWTHTALSGVAHYRLADDRTCVARIRELIDELPYVAPPAAGEHAAPPTGVAATLYDVLPDDHRQPYDMRALLGALVDDGHLDEFQADHAPEMICATARIDGVRIGVIANA